MKPRLYSSTETAFDTNGIGVLADAVSCIIETDLNGSYELTMKYPVNGQHFDGIIQRAIILAKPDPGTDPQPFRVYQITKPMRGTVTIYARHIAYDLLGVPAAPFTAASAADAMNQLKNNAATDCPFTFQTDKSTAANMTVSVPTAIWTLLGGSEGSVLDVYGGEYEFDRWTVNLWKRRGADRGVSIRYGKNLTTLEQDENCANCYTGVYPYWTNTDGDLVTLSEKILYADGTFDYTKILPLDLSEEWKDTPTEAQLRTRAAAYMTANDIGVPTISWKIEFVQLEQTEEYKDLGRLEQVLLGDSVSVLFSDLGVNATARVVEIVYDCILERYNSVTLGSVKSNLAQTVADQAKEIEKKPSMTVMEQVSTALGKAMLGAKGGYVRVLDTDDDGMPDELYIADCYDPDKAQKVWRFNYEGWAASANGYSGPFVAGATLENGLLAAAVTAAQLVAGYIKSADEGKTFFLDLDNGILRMNATALTINGATVEDTATNTAGNVAKSTANSVVNNLTQQDIFNKLTNNGETQGIYLEDGKIYINMEYANTGALSADCITLDGLFEVRKNNWIGGYIGYKVGDIGVGIPIDGVAMSSANGNSYIIITNQGARIQSTNAKIYLVNDSNEITVDGNLKVTGSITYGGTIAQSS